MKVSPIVNSLKEIPKDVKTKFKCGKWSNFRRIYILETLDHRYQSVSLTIFERLIKKCFGSKLFFGSRKLLAKNELISSVSSLVLPKVSEDLNKEESFSKETPLVVIEIQEQKKHKIGYECILISMPEDQGEFLDVHALKATVVKETEQYLAVSEEAKVCIHNVRQEIYNSYPHEVLLVHKADSVDYLMYFREAIRYLLYETKEIQDIAKSRESDSYFIKVSENDIPPRRYEEALFKKKWFTEDPDNFPELQIPKL